MPPADERSPRPSPGGQRAADAVEVGWPAMRVEDWASTRETLHRWVQIIGKLRLAGAPMINHWWQTTLTVTPRGLTTGSIPHGTGVYAIELDFHRHRLSIDRNDGRQAALELEPKSVAVFYAELMHLLDDLGIQTTINPVPVEVETAIPFAEDEQNASYDAEAVHCFWQQLVQADRVLRTFRSRYAGKVSPVHFFWGAMDLAVTRFSGRPAPRHPGGTPNCPDWIMHEGYSHELSSCGFWPGDDGKGAFYAYVYPEPDGYPVHPVGPAQASYVEEAGQFVLPYDVVRASADPDGTLLEFLQSSYEAAADLADWDRKALEYVPVEPEPK